MRRKARVIDTRLDRIQSGHTPAQRSGWPRDLADDLVSLDRSDPEFVPESILGLALSVPLVARVYLGDALGFAIYAMVSRPELYGEIRSEADTLFANGDLQREDFPAGAIDVTGRFLMECMHVYPVVPMSV